MWRVDLDRSLIELVLYILVKARVYVLHVLGIDRVCVQFVGDIKVVQCGLHYEWGGFPEHTLGS